LEVADFGGDWYNSSVREAVLLFVGLPRLLWSLAMTEKGKGLPRRKKMRASLAMTDRGRGDYRRKG
jgi:hypothetical protein